MKNSVKRVAALTFLLLIMIALIPVSSAAKEKKKGNPYLIKINKMQNTVTIYEKNKAIKAFPCSTGYATPTGTFAIQQKMRWHVLMGPCYGQYCSRIYKGILFHSVWYHKQNPGTLSNSSYNRLGTTASHGCVRLTVMDAKWIFDNCPVGTKIIIYNAKNPGPLGKPRAIKVPGVTGYDPTDIWSKGNPYNKKKPVIRGVKKKKIAYGDRRYKTMEGIRACNTTGYDVTRRVKVSIEYRKDESYGYDDVRKVNTKDPGDYRITYKLTDEIGRKTSVRVIHKVLRKNKKSKCKD
ncbi:MAG: L,D-transpeptidase family protein [Eubacterium sp.]